MGALNDWTTVDANNNQPPPDGWPENTMQYSDVNNTGRAVQGTMARFWGDVNGSLQAAGVADAYTLTLNETGYTSYFAGMYFACEIPATNTGATTIDVNGIGVQSVVSRDGSALTGGELDIGGIYEFRYDGTNFQLMGTIGAAIGTAQATLTNSNAPDLVDTDVALRVGASDPDTQLHLELGPQQLQSKSTATTPETLEINALGGDVTIGQVTGTPSGDTVEFYQNAQAMATFEQAAFVFRSDADGDETVPEVQTNEIIFESQDGNVYAEIGYQSSTTWRIANRAHGGVVQINAEDSGGVARQLFEANPDGNMLLNPPTGGDILLQEGGVTRFQLDNTNGRFVFNDYTQFLEERAAALADVAGYGQLWVRNDSPNILVFTDDAGTDFDIGGATAGFDPTSDQDITGAWTFTNAANDFELGVSTSLQMRNNADNSTTFIQNLGPTFQFGIAGGDFGSGVFEIGQSSFARVEAPPIFIGEQAAAEADIAGDGQVWVRNDTPNTLMFTDDAGTDYVIGGALAPGGGAQISGTPANNQLAVWVNATDIEGESELTFDGTRLQLQGATTREFAVRATGTGTGDDAAIYIEQQDSGDGLVIIADNEVLDERRISKTDGAGTEGIPYIVFGFSGLEFYFNGVEVANTQLAANDGFRVDDGDGLQGVLVDNGRKLNRGLTNLGGFSSEDFGLVTLTIDGTNIETYNGRRAQLNSGDTLRFGPLTSFTGHAGGTISFGSGAQNIGCGTGNSCDMWEFDSTGTFTYHNLSGNTTTSVTGPGFGVWMYVGTVQVFCALWTTS